MIIPLALQYSDAITSAMAFQITYVLIISSTDCCGSYQRKHRSSASLAFVRGIHRWPVDFPYKGPVVRKCFHLMTSSCWHTFSNMLTTIYQQSLCGSADSTFIPRKASQSSLYFLHVQPPLSNFTSLKASPGLNGISFAVLSQRKTPLGPRSVWLHAISSTVGAFETDIAQGDQRVPCYLSAISKHTHFTNSLWAHCLTIAKISIALE